jgi:hypothetical protein
MFLITRVDNREKKRGRRKKLKQLEKLMKWNKEDYEKLKWEAK